LDILDVDVGRLCLSTRNGCVYEEEYYRSITCTSLLIVPLSLIVLDGIDALNTCYYNEVLGLLHDQSRALLF
jgi:hypothetical protein